MTVCLRRLSAIGPIVVMLLGPASLLAEPSLSIDSSLSNPHPAVNEPVELSVVVTNAGPNAVTDISVSQQLAEDVGIPMGFAHFASHGDYTPLDGHWQIDALAASESATLVLPLVIDYATEASLFILESKIIAPAPLGIEAAKYETSTRLYTSQAPVASRVVLELTSVRTGSLGSLTVDVRATNEGPDPIEDVIVRLSVSSGASTLFPADPLDLGIIAAGSSATGQLVHLFNCGQGPYTADYTATLTSSSPLSVDSVTTESGSINGSGTGSCVIEYPAFYTGGCFVATAAYGSYLHSDVELLRNFRDSYLLTNEPGRELVALYYQYSPPIADTIARHEWLQFFVRVLLTPIVFALKYPLAGLFLSSALASIAMLRRRPAH